MLSLSNVALLLCTIIAPRSSNAEPVFGAAPFLGKRQQSEFQTCVANSTGAGRITVTVGSSSGFSEESKPYNLRIQVSPKAIVYPTTPEEVADVVKCASQTKLSVSARSGGHSYAAYGLAGDVVVDLSKMKQITVNSGDGTAVSQTGNHLGNLAVALWSNGRRVLPHGTCPYVGTGGHAGYGGYGYFSRYGGLLLDTIQAAQVVLANGTLVNTTSTEHPDLFWALRGAAPSFGIVTAWTFKTFEAPSNVVSFTITLSTRTEEVITQALGSYMTFHRDPPKELAMRVVIGADPSGGAYFQFDGDYYGTSEDFHRIIDPWYQSLPGGPSIQEKQLDWMENLAAKDGDFGNLKSPKPESHDTFFTKSLLATQPTSNEALATWTKFIFSSGLGSGALWYVIIDPWGGQIGATPRNATSFAHRDALYSYQLASTSGTEAFPEANMKFINDMWTSIAGSDKKKPQYTNYIDPTLDAESWPVAYYGENFQRLTQLKRVYDPDNLFRNNQSIPVGQSTQTAEGAGSSAISSVSVSSWTLLLTGGFIVASALI